MSTIIVGGNIVKTEIKNLVTYFSVFVLGGFFVEGMKSKIITGNVSIELIKNTLMQH